MGFWHIRSRNHDDNPTPSTYNKFQRREYGGRRKFRPKNPPKPVAPLLPPISRESRNEQLQSLLFADGFPAELRVAIYELVLGDNHRFMHVIPFDDQSDRVGRCRCIVPVAVLEVPTWQHKCFGTWTEDRGTSRCRKYTFNTRDNLLSLILSCHRSYLDALDILYTANRFSVKGARGIESFLAVTPPAQWDNIRILNISTMFLTPRIYWPEHEIYPPDNYPQWITSCSVLQSLRGLRSLTVEIILWEMHAREDTTAVEPDTLVFVLEPLLHIEVPCFEVELNVAPPEVVLEKLGRLSFALVVKYRPFDHNAFTL